jgi:hypothetical protein
MRRRYKYHREKHRKPFISQCGGWQRSRQIEMSLSASSCTGTAVQIKIKTLAWRSLSNPSKIVARYKFLRMVMKYKTEFMMK